MGVPYFACNNIYVAFVLCAKVASMDDRAQGFPGEEWIITICSVCGLIFLLLMRHELLFPKPLKRRC